MLKLIEDEYDKINIEIKELEKKFDEEATLRRDRLCYLNKKRSNLNYLWNTANTVPLFKKFICSKEVENLSIDDLINGIGDR